ncbi:MAG: hypothetical protein U0414_31600 [Polyangiaceae bacterium]
MIATQRERGALPIDVASRGLVAFDISVEPRDVVFVKGVIEASDGLATIFAEEGGSTSARASRAAPHDAPLSVGVTSALRVACPASREAELRALLADLGFEGADRVG